jgi:hypothetical protein
MGIILLVLLLALILGGLGFAIHILWWIALVILAIWLIGFLVRTAEGGGRWYRWLSSRDTDLGREKSGAVRITPGGAAFTVRRWRAGGQGRDMPADSAGPGGGGGAGRSLYSTFPLGGR